MLKCVIVIPVYKENPSKFEIASFRQCLSILGSHEIVIITHNNLSLYKYNIEAKLLGVKFKVEFFKESYFKSINGYNRLCLHKDFYIRFNMYKYMLIYQLDAWVFNDELNYWCDKDYDYIGAPWFEKNEEDYTTIFNGVGNGGFSLRKISYCLKVLNHSRYKPFITFENLNKNCSKSLIVLLKSLGIRNNISYYINNCVNEDVIFSQLSLLSKLKPYIPDEFTAAKFSFEINPSYLYKQNNNKLPFGCHAYEKYEYEEFWEKHIRH